MLLEGRLSKTKYLCGDEISIADISAACELDSAKFLQLDLSQYPKLAAWSKNIIDSNPVVLETHQLIRR